MMIEKYLRGQPKSEEENPLIVTNDQPRKAVFKKLNRNGGNGSGKKTRLTRRGLMRRGNSFVGYKSGQRVIVKIRYVKHKAGKSSAGGSAPALRDHLRYISRSGAGHDGVQASLFDGEQQDLKRNAFHELCAQDRHHFRFIISPENGHQIDDFQGYVRDVMKLASRDLGTRLSWVAAVHYDTDDVHAHVIVRGKTDRGEDLVIGQDYIKEGFRHRAQEVATKLLGERGLDDLQKSLGREVEALRVTSLDRFIETHQSPDGMIDVQQANNFGKSVYYEGIIKGRLRFLKTAGLAEELAPGRYYISEDFTDTLRDIATRNDVMKRLYNKVSVGLDNISIYSMSQGQGPTLEGRVVAKGFYDEISDRHYIVMREMTGGLHYVPVGSYKYFDDLQEGSLIRISAGASGSGKADYNIATQAKFHHGIYDPELHKTYIEQQRPDITAEDRAGYIEAHSIRLRTLESHQSVEPLGEGRYKIPEDLVVRGKEIDRLIAEKERKRFYPRVNILSKSVPEQDTQAHRKTWLDTELVKFSQGKGASVYHDEAIRAALEERKSWLVRQDLALVQSNGEFALRDRALQKLDKMELYEAGQKLADKLNLQFSDMQVKPDTAMTYEGYVNLGTGTWVAASRGRSLQLVHQDKEPDLKRGEPVIFEKGQGKAHEMTSIAKHKEQDREL